MSGICQLCCLEVVEIHDPVATILVLPYNYAAFPASRNLIAPLLLFDVSSRSCCTALASPSAAGMSHRVHTD